jgi:hypothetical protein
LISGSSAKSRATRESMEDDEFICRSRPKSSLVRRSLSHVFERLSDEKRVERNHRANGEYN